MAGISTHILDTDRGRPAAGIRIDFSVLEGETWRLVKSVVTNADGRTDQPILAPNEAKVGQYQLAFHVDDYFRDRPGTAEADIFIDNRWCASRSSTRHSTITCRCSARPAASPPTAAAEAVPDLAVVNRMEAGAFVALLGGVFEHAAWVAEAVAPQRPFASLADLHAAMMRIPHSAPADVQSTFLNGHPERVGPEARARALTADSASEQGTAGLDRMAQAETAAFARLNAAYRARFGVPFVIAVRGRGRAEILSVFETRLGRETAAERETAPEEVAQIARMRLDRLTDA